MDTCIDCNEPAKVKGRCQKHYSKMWRASNSERYRAQKKEYREANLERIKEHAREYYQLNKEKFSKRQNSYLESDPDKLHARQRAHYYSNKENYRKKQAAWGRANPGRVAERTARYKARKLRQNCGCVPSGTRQVLIETYGDCCVYCGGAFEHIDHFVALARGGKHCLGNLVPACSHCNTSKGGRLVKNWKKWNGATPTLACPNREI